MHSRPRNSIKETTGQATGPWQVDPRPVRDQDRTPVNPTGPRPLDLELLKKLEYTLQYNGAFEAAEATNNREVVLKKLGTLVGIWVHTLTGPENLLPGEEITHQSFETYFEQKLFYFTTINETKILLFETFLKLGEEIQSKLVCGKVHPFGSFRLGVHDRAGDIDALCLVPHSVNRQDFFSSFLALLSARPEVSCLRAIPKAFVPLIKMKFSGVDVDLTFVRLASHQVAENLDLTEDSILRGLGPECVRSLNGVRVTEEIIRLVPSMDTLRLALRSVKLWAKMNGVYGNVFGYLGGIAWTILVVRACQLCPNAAASTVVVKFLSLFSQWRWPEPVLIKPMHGSKYVNMGHWEPRVSSADRKHVMPIITPSYPQQNSTVTTSLATRQLMTEALVRGRTITEEILTKSATWADLFQPFPFFDKYKHYVLVRASSKTEEEQTEWKGLVESRIRYFTGRLEQNPSIKYPHLWPTAYNVSEPDRPATEWFVGLQVNQEGDVNMVLAHDMAVYRESVISHGKVLGIHNEGMEVDVLYVDHQCLAQYFPGRVKPYV